MSKKRDVEAREILKKVAVTNGKEFNEELWNKFLSSEADLVDI